MQGQSYKRQVVDRWGHHLGYISAIVQWALSLIQAGRLVEDRDFQ